MKHFIYDDGGRAEAGVKAGSSDCVARAIAVVSGRPYRDVYTELALINLRMRKTARRSDSVGTLTAARGIYTSSVPFKNYMHWMGFVWTPTMSIGSGCRVHLRASELPKGRLVVAVSKHYTAVIDGVIHDTGDPSRGGTRCVYGFWQKRAEG